MAPLFGHRATSQPRASCWWRACWPCHFALAAQTASPTQEADWRGANDAVGALKRGHADVLKWEQANTSAATATPASTLGVAMPTTEVAVRMAWTVHRDLARALARLGPKNEQPDREPLDRTRPSLQRRVEDASGAGGGCGRPQSLDRSCSRSTGAEAPA